MELTGLVCFIGPGSTTNTLPLPQLRVTPINQYAIDLNWSRHDHSLLLNTKDPHFDPQTEIQPKKDSSESHSGEFFSLGWLHMHSCHVITQLKSSGWVGVGHATLWKGDQCDGLDFIRAAIVLEQILSWKRLISCADDLNILH